MLMFLLIIAFLQIHLDMPIPSIQELPFTHGLGPWNSALRVIRIEKEYNDSII